MCDRLRSSRLPRPGEWSASKTTLQTERLMSVLQVGSREVLPGKTRRRVPTRPLAVPPITLFLPKPPGSSSLKLSVRSRTGKKERHKKLHWLLGEAQCLRMRPTIHDARHLHGKPAPMAARAHPPSKPLPSLPSSYLDLSARILRLQLQRVFFLPLLLHRKRRKISSNLPRPTMSCRPHLARRHWTRLSVIFRSLPLPRQ
jgi:hypothetical protein